jgi:hypothetical protein
MARTLDRDVFVAREWLARYGLEPTDADVAEMRHHLDGDPTFEVMPNKNRAKLFRGMLEIRRLNELFDERAHHYATPRRKGDPERLRLALKQITAIFKAGVEGDNAHVARVVRAMSERLGITFADAAERLFLVDETMRLMLEVNETLPHLPALDTSRPTKTQVENQRVIELLESLNMKVGATNKGGPGSRLLKRILGYTSEARDYPALKQRLMRARRRKRGDR